ncbi:MAG: Glu-tRNA(Gln) amidotransferase subunit GatE [bacterium]|nr:Glu-tRNA(Gln) amidotransferase subunit GatE [bacterium]
MSKNIDFNDLKFYQKIGFMSGLEVHQQLKTEKKLFCHCPIEYLHNEPDARILRHMRPTLSEMGTYDGTALMEFKTKKNVIYNLFTKVNCTYEMDDTPPFLINTEALEIAVEICLLFNCAVVDEIHVARKQYLDGSIPTGFQRTLIIGLQGWMPYKDRKIRIRQISLEEDSCREISDIGHTINFKGDRLGIPLVEIVTEPDMKTPIEVMEVADLIGTILRKSGRVRSGIGATRKDVNVGVPEGTRIEIKGVSKLKYIPALTHYEALRQTKLLELKKELQIRGINKDTFKSMIRNLTPAMKKNKTNSLYFKNALKEKLEVKAILLKGLGGLLNKELQPNFTFSDEISGRIRVIACLDNLPNIIHTDMPSEKHLVPDAELDEIKKLFGFETPDVIVFTWGENADVETALNEVKLRIIDAMDGVPSETRQAFPDGHTDFERILPGPERMYPDTDHPAQQISKELLDKIKKNIKNTYNELHELYLKKLKVPEKLIKPFVLSSREPLIRKLLNSKTEPSLINEILFNTFTYLKRCRLNPDNIQDTELELLFESIRTGEINTSEVKQILKDALQSNIKLSEILNKLESPVEFKQVKPEMDKILKESKEKKLSLLYKLLREKYPDKRLPIKEINEYLNSKAGK